MLFFVYLQMYVLKQNPIIARLVY